MRTTPFVKKRHSKSLLLSTNHLLLLLCIISLIPVFVYSLRSFQIAYATGTLANTAQLEDIFSTPPPAVDVPTTEPMPMETISLRDTEPQFFDRPNVVGMKNFTQLSFSLPYEQEWREYPHLVVYGVLATDKAERRSIRDMQRSTWLRYPDVATRWNAFNGLMLVLYPAAPFALVAPNITVDMMKEMDEYHDVLLLRMKEEAPTKQRAIGTFGYYGLPFHVSNSRKLLFYLLYAHYAFPTTPFIAKGDDDSYVHVPEYMRMVRQLPRINVVYGATHRVTHIRKFLTALGYSYLITRDVLKDIFKHDAVTNYLNLPVSDKYSKNYVDIGFHKEDWIVGVSLNRLYGGATAAPRPMPSLPTADDRLPPVEGWGKHYMEYVFNPNNTAHTGRAVGSNGRYRLKYTFPSPNELKPGNVLFVDDKCRINNQRWPTANQSRLIVAHRPTTPDQFKAHWEHNEGLGDDTHMRRPRLVQVNKFSYFNYVALKGMGKCQTNFLK